jgi:NhaP-type Na+/H+ or K+/H+ antiporter
MYLNAALLAAFVLLYALVSGRVERSRLSGPIVFVLAGVLLGPASGSLSLRLSAEHLRILAELTLAVVLFCDAANADVALIRRDSFLPRRLLLVGLPLTVLLGFLAGWVLFTGLAAIEIALIAAILAPTDAALGKPVVTNPAVPANTREALNFESGLNDGICVPLVILLLEVAVGTELDRQPLAHILATVVEEIGIGLAVGVALALPAAFLIRRAFDRGWVGATWTGLPAVALAVACFALAQHLGGSGFIACFTGGLVFGVRRAESRHALLEGAESVGDALALLTWVVFGAIVVWPSWGAVTPSVLAYAVLSLTLVRMLPVALSLAGTPVPAADRLFIGWFGPRGLASIVFGVLVLGAHLPHGDTITATIVCTVLLSVLAHGVTANPLVRALAPAWRARPPGGA